MKKPGRRKKSIPEPIIEEIEYEDPPPLIVQKPPKKEVDVMLAHDDFGKYQI